MDEQTKEDLTHISEILESEPDNKDLTNMETQDERIISNLDLLNRIEVLEEFIERNFYVDFKRFKDGELKK